ncbi:MAG: LytTR family DNA-binding domain-containing protein [Bacilli bacterium]|nr:LytTR family DNA-binding domain-containing protein [Bacilli bacterium]
MITRNIAVLEDEIEAFELIEGFIRRFGKENDIEFNITHFSKCSDFLSSEDGSFAVVFFDIRLPDMNGMDASKKFREKNKVSSIIFLTSLSQYAQMGYEVDAISYLVKPAQYFPFATIFKKALNVYEGKREKTIMINFPSGMRNVSINELIYVEILSHRLYYHLVDDVIEMTGTLANAEKMCKPYGFLRCNNCYLVNPLFVKGIKGFELEIGNTTLQISRARRKDFLAELSNWYINKGGKVL